MTLLAAAFILLVATSLADVVTTRLGLERGGLMETNPLMRWSTRSWARAVLTKTVGLVVVGTLLLRVPLDSRAGAVSLTIGAAWYTGWLAWRNWRLLRLPLEPAVVWVSRDLS